MAEARLAVGFNFAVDDDGELNVDFDINSFKVVAASLKKFALLRVRQISHNLDYLFFPLIPFYIYLPLAYLISLIGYSSNFFVITKTFAVVSYVMPGGYAIVKNFFAAVSFPFMLYFFSSAILQYIIGKCIMLYIYTQAQLSVNKTSYKIVKVLNALQKLSYTFLKKCIGNKYGLFTLQKALPTLSVPSLKSTMDTWLRSIRPLVNDKEYEKNLKQADEFVNGVGKKLQWLLILKSWFYENYYQDWWEKYVYLSCRSPLVINSNYFCFDRFEVENPNPASRAGNVVSCMFEFMESIKNGTLKPIINNEVVPLCSNQYTRLFGTSRIPCYERDIIKHYDESKHIVVLHKGRYFKFPFVCNGKRLSNRDLEAQFEYIINNTTETTEEEINLAALTALPRNEWAHIRTKHFSTGANKLSYNDISKAAIFVSFVEDEVETDSKEALTKFGKALIHNRGNTIWFDKSFTCLVFKNGKVGLNVEHSWADAPIMSHMSEYMLFQEELIYGYEKGWKCKGVRNFKNLDEPIRMKWDLNYLKTELTDAFDKVKLLIKELDLVIYPFSEFGKGRIKKMKISPDAFIQIALQLAYYEDIGNFDLTYEASMLRLFRSGRTETVRACTNESCKFILAYKNPNISKEEKITLFRKAAGVHVNQYRKCMLGLGCDRHLFALYVSSKIINQDVPFLKEILAQPWKLSTSQTPIGLGKYADLNSGLKNNTPGGGFGPVADDGYGVSYIICGDNLITFNISSKSSSDKTDSERFLSNLKKSMLNLATLFD